jgi:hypothetical protein
MDGGLFVKILGRQRAAAPKRCKASLFGAKNIKAYF